MYKKAQSIVDIQSVTILKELMIMNEKSLGKDIMESCLMRSQ